VQVFNGHNAFLRPIKHFDRS